MIIASGQPTLQLGDSPNSKGSRALRVLTRYGSGPPYILWRWLEFPHKPQTSPAASANPSGQRVSSSGWGGPEKDPEGTPSS